jgi:NAD(P)-dependent dehydrogenase (short-subunit alcohol dehydrogenase family)
VTVAAFAADALAGKRVVITGGGTGLGLGVAKHLVDHGAVVHLWGRRRQVLEEAAATISSPRDRAVEIDSVDVRDADAVDAAMERAFAFGPVTSVINNAAGNFIAPTETISPRAYAAIRSTVMDGSFHTALAAGTRWIDRGLPGCILSTLTTWVWTGSAFVVPSAMSKAAVHAMTMSLAVEWARYGIRLNAIAPGPIPTEDAWKMLNPTKASGSGATQTDGIPAGRYGTVEELAALTILLLSDACPYLTGETIAMDGGQRLAGPGTFAGLRGMSAEDWRQAAEQTRAASAASRAQRT